MIEQLEKIVNRLTSINNELESLQTGVEDIIGVDWGMSRNQIGTLQDAADTIGDIMSNMTNVITALKP